MSSQRLQKRARSEDSHGENVGEDGECTGENITNNMLQEMCSILKDVRKELANVKGELTNAKNELGDVKNELADIKKRVEEDSNRAQKHMRGVVNILRVLYADRQTTGSLAVNRSALIANQTPTIDPGSSSHPFNDQTISKHPKYRDFKRKLSSNELKKSEGEENEEGSMLLEKEFPEIFAAITSDFPNDIVQGNKTMSNATSTDQTAICPICLNLEWTLHSHKYDPTSNNERLRDISLYKLRVSGRGTCTICRILYNGIVHFSKIWLRYHPRDKNNIALGSVFIYLRYGHTVNVRLWTPLIVTKHQQVLS